VSKPDYYDEFFFHEDLKKRFWRVSLPASLAKVWKCV
jgi:hypothetical protein